MRPFYTLLLIGIALLAQSRSEEIILVKLKRAPGLTADNVLHPSWEEKRIKLRFKDIDWDDTFTDDTREEEDPPISQCFLPQVKLITDRYTFIVSLGCGNIITFQNKAPFTPSPNRVQNPFDFSDEFRYFIEKIVEKHLKIPPKRFYAEYALSYTPPAPDISYEELDFLVGQSQIVVEEDDDNPEDEPPSPTESPADWMAPTEEEEEGDD